MRWLTYNILNGGQGRLDPIAETLAYLDADVVGLLEANDPDAVTYLANKGGYTPALAESPTCGLHAALLTRRPLERMINFGVRHPRLNRAALEAILEIDGRRVRVVVLHLLSGLGAPFEAERLAELDLLLADIAGDEPLPTVLMGDLNSNAATHAVDLAEAEPAVAERLREQPDLIVTDVVDRLLGAGWIDGLNAVLGEDVPHTFSTGYPSTRLDYIFLSADMEAAIRDAGVETGGFTPYCSDHFPVWVDLAPERIPGSGSGGSGD